MSFMGWVYEKVTGREASRPLRRYSLPFLVWKMVRKYLSASVIPYCPFNALRILGYRLVGFKIGKRVFIGMRCYMDDVIPSNTVIEDNVTVSYHVTFACHGPRMKNKKCILREGCYIGANATILGGVEIGPYATVGAAAMVSKSLPPLSVAVGVPARVIKTGLPPWEGDDERLDELKAKYLKDDPPPDDAVS